MTQRKEHKVVIIGAGVAGLAAGSHLMKNGFKDFIIIEARSRIGGRILSIDMDPSQKVELGANWIHGVLGNPIFEFAISHGLVNIINIPKPQKNIVAALESGQQVPFGVLHEIYQAYICFLKRCEEYFLCQYQPPPDIYSVGEHINLEIDLYLKNVTDVKEKNLKKLIFECLLKRETCITGCDNMDDIDLLEMGSFQELQGGNIVLPSGYSSILVPLSDKISDKIVLKCPIKTIKWKRKKSPGQLGEILEDDEEEEESDGNDSDKTITDEPISSSKTINNESNVQIICENNEIYFADHIICTIPLGCLKDNTTLFDPKLPAYKKESIERLLFGTVDKIFLTFDIPILNANISEVMLLWEPDEEDTECDSSDENDFSNHTKKFWYKKIYSFSKINDQTLLGWISGKEAEFMETLDEKTIADKCTEILRIFLRDPFIPHPIKCICTNWRSEKYSCGSYTSLGVGATQEDIENIAQPLFSNPHHAKPSVVFAGEHTHSSFYSTVHGAYLSGRTAAQLILTPDSPQEIVVESADSDLSAWIQGIALD